MNSEGSKICVAIRKRPLNRKEQNNGETDIVVVKNGQTVIVSEYKQKVDLTKYIQESAFNFDYAFDENCNNQQIYCRAVRPLVESAFLGARVTCFAYGQTGSGKTYTMNGDLKQGVPGLYILGANDIFGYRNNKQYNHLKITVSFFEIYCGKLFDLLNNRTELKIRQDNKQNVHIVGLKEDPINTPQQFMKTIQYGSNFRVTSQNSTNADSSRSHAILQICLKQGKKIYGKISFIDLAGCQRGADHMDQNKQTRIDGAEINKSLLSLKECIRALDQGKGHTPFRGSKLTMVLKDSFVGFCMTVMIGNISPNINSCENTLNTLRYADRVKQLKKPNGNNEPLSKEDQLAKELMLPRNGKNAVKIMINNDDDAEDIMNKKMQAQKLLGIRNDQPKMMAEEPFIRPKNNTVVQKQPLKRLESQDARVLNKGYQPPGMGIGLKNESNLFDNSKTIQMRPKQNTLFSQQSQNQGQKIQNQHPYAQKTQNRPNEVRGTFTQPQNNYIYNQSQNQNQNLREEEQFNFQASNNIYNPFGIQCNQHQNNSQQQFNQAPQYNPQNYQQKTNQTQYSNSTSWAPQQQKNQQFNQSQNYQNQSNTQSFNSQPSQNQRYYQQNQNANHFQSQQPYNIFNDPNRRQSFKPETNFNFQSQPQSQPQPQFQNQFSSNPFRQQTSSSNNPSNSIQAPKQYNRPMMVEDESTRHPEILDWENTVNEFKNWRPTNNMAELKYFRDVHQYLIEKLVQQQDSITSEHSQTINREIETIKGEMKFIQQIERNKATHESIEYAEFVEDMIDRKISALVKLKKRVNVFKQHLLDHQQCEQKIFMAQEQMGDQPDQQLLDDIQSDY